MYTKGFLFLCCSCREVRERLMEGIGQKIAGFVATSMEFRARVASAEIVRILCSGGATVLEVCLIGGDAKLRS
jgi:hypothetical protein